MADPFDWAGRILRRQFSAPAPPGDAHPDRRPPPPLPPLQEAAVLLREPLRTRPNLHPDQMPPPRPRLEPSPLPSPPRMAVPFPPPPPELVPVAVAPRLPPLPLTRSAFRGSRPPATSTIAASPFDLATAHRAAGIVRLLSTSNLHRRKVSSAISELLAEFPHATTVRALTALAEEGHLLEEILAYGALKLRWREDPAFWLKRNRIGQIDCDPRLRHALSWRAAARLCAAHGLEDGSIRVVDDLRTEWLSLPIPTSDRADASWWTYAAYVSTEGAMPETWQANAQSWDVTGDPVPGRSPGRVPTRAGYGATAPLTGPPALLPEIFLSDHRPLQSRPEEAPDV